jgi:hypothetical protein
LRRDSLGAGEEKKKKERKKKRREEERERLSIGKKFGVSPSSPLG